MYRIYRYDQKEIPYRHLYIDRPNVPFEERAESKACEFRMDESLSRTRRIIKDTILCNSFSLFCTFTFDSSKVEDRFDFPSLRKQLCQFFNNYRKRYDSCFRYLVIPEHHKDGAIHFHGVITLPRGLCTPLYVYKHINEGFSYRFKNKNHYCDWPAFSERFGYFSCSLIRKPEACSTYVAKYITKELAQWGKNYQLVLKSKGLKKPELVYASDTDRLQLKPNDVDNEWCQSAWADEEYTARFYRGWWYPEKDLQWLGDDETGRVAYRSEDVDKFYNPWKYKAWPSYDESTGCAPLTAEQIDFLNKNSLGVI